jgi:class 3 adenylate cyclase
MSASLGTRAFLFADLRGYTRFVEAHGDAAASELLVVYRDLVRGVIGRHDGAEIRTEGDGVYVVFDSVADAVDAGLELTEAAGLATAARPDRPIRLAAGIHAGETTAGDEGPVGSAVNVAARICAKAEAGEILVSETVRALVRTARPYSFTALGPQQLKGVREAIALYRIEAAPSSRSARLARQARARRRLLAVTSLAAAAILVAAGAAWAASRPPDCLTLPADSEDVVLRVDTDRGCVTQVVAVGHGPRDIVAVDDGLWVADREGWTLTHVATSTGRVDGWLGLPGAPISVVTNAAGDLVILAYDDRTRAQTLPGTISYESNTRHRVVYVSRPTRLILEAVMLPADARTQGSFTLSGYSALATAWDMAWVVGPRGTLVRAKRTGFVSEDLLALGASAPGIVTAMGGTVWIADQQKPVAFRFDGAGSPARSVPLRGSSGSRAAVARPDAVWLLRAGGIVTRVDSTTGSQQDIDAGGDPTGLAIAGDAIWLIDSSARTVREIDPASGATRATIDTGGQPGGAVVYEGSLWVTIAAR